MKEILHFNVAFKNKCLCLPARKDFQLSFSNSNMCKINVACPMYYYIYWVITWCSMAGDTCMYHLSSTFAADIYFRPKYQAENFHREMVQ